MPNFNRVILMGNLTRDPELRYTPSGTAVTDFGMAINRRRRSQDGDRRDETVFVTVTAWARQAEVINEHFSKGRPIFGEGRLHLDEWTSSDGTRRSKLKVVLENFEFISPRGEMASRPPQDSYRQEPQRPAPRRKETAGLGAEPRHRIRLRVNPAAPAKVGVGLAVAVEHPERSLGRQDEVETQRTTTR